MIPSIFLEDNYKMLLMLVAEKIATRALQEKQEQAYRMEQEISAKLIPELKNDVAVDGDGGVGVNEEQEEAPPTERGELTSTASDNAFASLVRLLGVTGASSDGMKSTPGSTTQQSATQSPRMGTGGGGMNDDDMMVMYQGILFGKGKMEETGQGGTTSPAPSAPPFYVFGPSDDPKTTTPTTSLSTTRDRSSFPSPNPNPAANLPNLLNHFGNQHHHPPQQSGGHLSNPRSAEGSGSGHSKGSNNNRDQLFRLLSNDSAYQSEAVPTATPTTGDTLPAVTSTPAPQNGQEASAGADTNNGDDGGSSKSANKKTTSNKNNKDGAPTGKCLQS